MYKAHNVFHYLNNSVEPCINALESVHLNWKKQGLYNLVNLVMYFQSCDNIEVVMSQLCVNLILALSSLSHLCLTT